jgi:hypothetical protein
MNIKRLEDIEAVPPFLDSSAILRDMKKSARRLTLNPGFIGKP